MHQIPENECRQFSQFGNTEELESTGQHGGTQICSCIFRGREISRLIRTSEETEHLNFLVELVLKNMPIVEHYSL